MTEDFEIGRVLAVDTEQVTVALAQDLKALVRSTFESPQEVGRINSFVFIPAGARRLVGVVTRIVLTEETPTASERSAVLLPRSRRLMNLTLVGSIDSGVFSQGVSVYPTLDSPVLLASSSDLDAVFAVRSACVPDEGTESGDEDGPGYCVQLGHSAVFSEYPVRLNPDAAFGKHLAVLGSTGSGKSCTIASLIQRVVRSPGVRRSHFVILDTNGEYRRAFPPAGKEKYLNVPSDAALPDERLRVPYWFMDSEEFSRLFGAAEGVQRPVLVEALRRARSEGHDLSEAIRLREEIIRELNRLHALVGSDEKTSKGVRDLAAGLARFVSGASEDAWKVLESDLGCTQAEVLTLAKSVEDGAGPYVEKGMYPTTLPVDVRSALRSDLELMLARLSEAIPEDAHRSADTSPDAPAHFGKHAFRMRHLEQALRGEASGGGRARDYASTMLLRIDRLLRDGRFDFLFGPVGAELPEGEHVLATFIRDLLGLPTRAEGELSDGEAVSRQAMPFYDRIREGSEGHRVVVLDLSLLASEVIGNVTALLGRLILEFLQRLGEGDYGFDRGALPVVLVLEEAQNYIPDRRLGAEESASRDVFERIAREGRKYGLGLVVSSQRPSELSKTVLSQCSSFIVHRLQNPDDLRYFREVVPSLYGPLLGQLPMLPAGTALVLGECVPVPGLVRVARARPEPRSRDPRFWRYWTSAEAPDPPVEEVCTAWEGGGVTPEPKPDDAPSAAS